jgi:hypothetical protein
VGLPWKVHFSYPQLLSLGTLSLSLLLSTVPTSFSSIPRFEVPRALLCREFTSLGPWAAGKAGSFSILRMREGLNADHMTPDLPHSRKPKKDSSCTIVWSRSQFFWEAKGDSTADKLLPSCPRYVECSDSLPLPKSHGRESCFPSACLWKCVCLCPQR